MSCMKSSDHLGEEIDGWVGRQKVGAGWWVRVRRRVGQTVGTFVKGSQVDVVGGEW